MIVEVTNLTDSPGKSPTEIVLFGRTLSPGDSIKVYAALVDKKTRSLEEAGYISIGQIPPWYAAFKDKHKGRVLTREELEKQLITVKPISLPEPPKVAKVEKVEPEVREEAAPSDLKKKR